MNERAKVIGENVARLRQKAGLSQADLAKAIGVNSQNTIAAIELGRTKKSKHLADIASVLQVAMTDINPWFSGKLVAPHDRAQALTSSGRRLENIRKALMPDLPNRIGISQPQWLELIASHDALEADVVMQVHAATGLPSGYIGYADPTGIPNDVMAKLLATALDDEFADRTVRPRASAPAVNRRRRAAKAKKP